MPKRRAFANNLQSIFRKRRRMRVDERELSRRSALIEHLESRTLLSSSWYVSTTGNDSNPGTLAAPFHTIQHAATIANSGDTVIIRGGVYRETVHPSHGGVTFDAYGSENVVVSGADPITGWSQYGGSIYQASMSWDLGEGNNQIFVNGQMVNEARWPNTTNLSYPTLASIQSGGGGGSNVTIHDSHLSGGWTGAGIHIMPGAGWYAQTGTVTASGPGWLTFNYAPDTSYTVPRAGNQYYLYGKFQALDSPGEWYRDNSGKLYLWAPNSANPSTLDVEAKHRAYAFDLSGDWNTTLNGINIFAATIKTDARTTNLVINHMRATYLSQFTWESKGFLQPVNAGIALSGANSLLENSTIAWSAGDGVYITGANSHVTQNVFHDIDYNAGDSAPIHNLAKGAVIDHNLIYNAARSGIIDQAYSAQILNNTIHDVMLQTSDGGGIYTVGQNGSGSLIANNLIYSIHEHIADIKAFSANGIFLDNNASGWLIEYNQIDNTDAAVKMNFWSTGNKVINNVLNGSLGSIVGNAWASWSGTLIQGNTLYSPIAYPNPGATIVGNTMASGTPKLSASTAPGPDAQPPALPSGSHGGSSSSSSSSSGSSSGSSSSSSGSSSSDSDPSPAPPAPPPPPPPVNAFAPIPAGSASGSLGTLPVIDGSVVGSGGNWLRYNSVDFGKGTTKLLAQVNATSTAGLKLEFRLDSASGTVMGTIHPRAKHRGKNSRIQLKSVKTVSGVHDLYLVFVGRKGEIDVQSFQFVVPVPKHPKSK